jgi:hypothetical protein
LAVATLLFLMNGLFFYILKNAARRLGRFSRLNMIHRANVYDELLENKEAELGELLRKLEKQSLRKNAAPPRRREAKAQKSEVSDFFSLMKGRYRDGDFAEAYRLLRESETADRQACAAEALRRIGGETARRERNPAREILSIFDLELRYKLCCLDEADAFRILEETLTDDAQRSLLDGFRRAARGGVIAFFDWLRIRSFREAPEIVIRTGSPDDRFPRLAPDGRPVVTEYDGGVCEGLYAVAGGRTYDFSVRNGDISG